MDIEPEESENLIEIEPEDLIEECYFDEFLQEDYTDELNNVSNY
jgi:hypothetical protein